MGKELEEVNNILGKNERGKCIYCMVNKPINSHIVSQSVLENRFKGSFALETKYNEGLGNLKKGKTSKRKSLSSKTLCNPCDSKIFRKYEKGNRFNNIHLDEVKGGNNISFVLKRIEEKFGKGTLTGYEPIEDIGIKYDIQDRVNVLKRATYEDLMVYRQLNFVYDKLLGTEVKDNKIEFRMVRSAVGIYLNEYYELNKENMSVLIRGDEDIGRGMELKYHMVEETDYESWKGYFIDMLATEKLESVYAIVEQKRFRFKEGGVKNYFIHVHYHCLPDKYRLGVKDLITLESYLPFTEHEDRYMCVDIPITKIKNYKHIGTHSLIYDLEIKPERRRDKKYDKTN